MKLQTKAVDVLERTSHYLKAGVLQRQPAWFKVIAQYPPNKNFLREPKRQLKSPFIATKGKPIDPISTVYKTRSTVKANKDIYKPQKLSFVEDELRSLFYEQHPWELARPKILLENTGEDYTTQDWSNIKQVNKGLDGESVVQRTIYLLRNEGLSLADAYDKARFEFYRVRIENEITENISAEENAMFGAVHAKGTLEHGVEQEQKVIDQWKIEAQELSNVIDAKLQKPEDAAAASRSK